MNRRTGDDPRTRVLDAVWRYHQEQGQRDSAFVPGVSWVGATGAAYEAVDRVALVEAALDMDIAAGRRVRLFESSLAHKMDRRRAYLTNTAFAATHLALSALSSDVLEDRRVRAGDEVIMAATGPSSTLHAVLQNGLVPVFVDVTPGTYTTTAERVAAATGPRTRVIVLEHTLGNPFEVHEISRLALERDLFLVEGNGDALGSTYGSVPTGAFGHLTTMGFHPGHHLAMGGSGCVLTSSPLLIRAVEARLEQDLDCWCPSDGHVVEDHGRNRHPCSGITESAADLQAGLGLSQLAKLDDLCAARRRNWARLREGLDGVSQLRLPEPTPRSNPSWAGFAVTVSSKAWFDRADLVGFLGSRRIGTRRLYSGNLADHPACACRSFRVAGNLTTTEAVAQRTFWLGVHPGLSNEMIDYVVRSIREFAGANDSYACLVRTETSRNAVAAGQCP